MGKAKFPWDHEPISHKLELLGEGRGMNGFFTLINPLCESFELHDENLGTGLYSIPQN